MPIRYDAGNSDIGDMSRYFIYRPISTAKYSLCSSATQVLPREANHDKRAARWYKDDWLITTSYKTQNWHNTDETCRDRRILSPANYTDVDKMSVASLGGRTAPGDTLQGLTPDGKSFFVGKFIKK